MDKLERLKKYANGGKVTALQAGGHAIRQAELDSREEMLDVAFDNAQKLVNPEQRQQMLNDIRSQYESLQNDRDLLTPQKIISSLYMPQTKAVADPSNLSFNTNTNKVDGNVEIKYEKVDDPSAFFANATSTQQNEKQDEDVKGTWKPSTAEALMMGGAAIAAVNAIDTATMGDKNFSASSKAIDTTVHGVSSALMKSGNPWAIGGAVLLEGLNFATKAGGQNVQGYDVDIQNSGYGNLSHQDSEAGRVWDKWSGATSRKLAKRNEQARMALAAADISQDQKFELEARANSVEDILRQNTIALNGGIDTSLLGS